MELVQSLACPVLVRPVFPSSESNSVKRFQVLKSSFMHACPCYIFLLPLNDRPCLKYLPLGLAVKPSILRAPMICSHGSFLDCLMPLSGDAKRMLTFPQFLSWNLPHFSPLAQKDRVHRVFLLFSVSFPHWSLRNFSSTLSRSSKDVHWIFTCNDTCMNYGVAYLRPALNSYLVVLSIMRDDCLSPLSTCMMPF